MLLELHNGTVLETDRIDSVVPIIFTDKHGFTDRPGCKVRYLDGRTVKVDGITASEVLRLVKENKGL